MAWGYGGGFGDYVSAAEKKRRAAREIAALVKRGLVAEPVELTTKKITTTFWGTAWCDNLERYRDYANRLERGRTYVRNGSVVHLAITPGTIEARVAGSELYEVKIAITPCAAPRWKSLCADCGGSIDSLVELLQGRFGAGVIERLCRMGDGLFPTPSEIRMSCDCPDSAGLCKHLAAVLYGVGARLDAKPELLFTLRKVDAGELLAGASRRALALPAISARRRLPDAGLALFGLELVDAPAAPVEETDEARPKRKPKPKPKPDPKPTPAPRPRSRR